MKKVVYLLLVGGCFSCVTNKRIQYLQNDLDENVEEITTNQVIRTYSPKSEEYKIQPQDLLSIQVESLTSEEFDFFSTNRNTSGNISEGNAAIVGELVDPGGQVELPVIGRINVMGLTVFQVQSLIQEKLNLKLKDPVVKVRLLNFRFTIMGEVKNEETITTFNNRTTVLEAITLAGGLTDLANRSVIKLIRTNGKEVEIQYLDLLDENLIESPYFYIHQNDVIIVPPLKQRPFKTNFGPNLSIILSGVSTLLLIVNLFR